MITWKINTQTLLFEELTVESAEKLNQLCNDLQFNSTVLFQQDSPYESWYRALCAKTTETLQLVPAPLNSAIVMLSFSTYALMSLVSFYRSNSTIKRSVVINSTLVH